ncbi:MAG: chemotaxis protein CheW [Oligoflexales bacterium]
MVDIDPTLMQTFLEESEENLAIAEKHLLEMENSDQFTLDDISAIFRAIHSFKGGSSFFNLTTLVNLLHVVESLLSNLQNSVFPPSKEMFSAVLESLDVARTMLYAQDYGESTDITLYVGKITQLNANGLNKNTGLHLFDEDEEQSEPAADPVNSDPEATEKKVPNESNRHHLETSQVDASKISAFEGEKKQSPTKPSTIKAPNTINKSSELEKESNNKRRDNEPRKSQQSSTVRVKTELIDNILDQVGEVILVRNQLAKKYPDEDMVGALSQRIGKLHNTILETRMQSVSTLFEKFHRVVRDLSLQLDKNIVLHIDAGEVELDRTILESFSDPMTHLVRNAADHGLESTNERVHIGKSPQGNLYLSASQKGGKVEIEVEDDGAGIDVEKVRERAVEKGLISDHMAEEMSESACMNLIMLPGFSTRLEASELSGRGVGMDVVKSSVEDAGGALKVFSRQGKGTKFTASFPLTLAIATALIVKAKDQRFAIPELMVDEISTIRWSQRDEVIKISEGQMFFKHRGVLIPTVLLSDILQINNNGTSQIDKYMFKNVVLCKHNGIPFSVIVDKILNIEDIAVKGLPLLISDCSVFSGLTVLENGEVSMLLDISKVGEDILSRTATNVHEDEVNDLKQTAGESRKEQIIVFTNAENEYFGIHIDFLSEISAIKSEEVEKVGDAEFYKLHGNHVPLIRIEDYLPISVPEDRNNLLVFVSSTNFPIGIIATKAIKVQHIGDDLNSKLADRNGILSTIIDDGHMVTILDMYALFRRRAPEHFKSFENIGKGVCVLLVEDTSFFIVLLSQYLKEAGFEVIVAKDGVEALEKLHKEENQIKAMISDIIMPKMDGFELIERVRRSKIKQIANIPSIAVTAISEEEHISRIKESGFDACISKNEKDKLLSRLYNLVIQDAETIAIKKAS